MDVFSCDVSGINPASIYIGSSSAILTEATEMISLPPLYYVVLSIYYIFYRFILELLSDICCALSEEELISDDSFFDWENNSKNGIAIKSVSQFFQWLRTSD